MNKTIITLLILLSIGVLCSQAHTWLWSSGAGGTASEESFGIATDSGNNSYIAGYYSGTAAFGQTSLTSVSSYYDICVAKLDSLGNWLWAASAGGSFSDKGLAITTDANGNCYVTGSIRSTATFGALSVTSYGQEDIFIAKLDSNGNWLWVVHAGGSGEDSGQGISTDSSGNCYVSGYFYSNGTFGTTVLSNTGQETFAAKLDAVGNWLWVVHGGSITSDNSAGISLDINGNIYITGSFRNTATFGTYELYNSGEYDVYIAKLDADGNWLWAQRAGGTGYDISYAIATDASGNSHITGYFSGTASFGGTNLICADTSYSDVFIAKLDANGNWLWAQRAGGTDYDMGKGIAAGLDGSIYTIGRFDDTTVFGNDTLPCPGTAGTFFAMADANGQWLWAECPGATELDFGFGLKTGSNGDILATGSFINTAVFGDHTLASAGAKDIFVARLNDASIQAGTIQAVVQDLQQQPIENAAVTCGTVSTFTNAAGICSLQVVGGTYDVTASHQDYSSVTLNNVVVEVGQTTSLTFTLAPTTNEDPLTPAHATFLLGGCPNPFEGTTTIRYRLKEAGPATIEIFNIRGQKVKTLVCGYVPAGSNSVFWNGCNDDGKTLSGGIYLCRMTSSDQTFADKLLLLK